MNYNGHCLLKADYVSDAGLIALLAWYHLIYLYPVGSIIVEETEINNNLSTSLGRQIWRRYHFSNFQHSPWSEGDWAVKI